MTRYLVTGVAGFIGNHVALRLLGDGHEVVGVDRVDAYYDPALKEARLARLADQPNFTFSRTALEDRTALMGLFETHRPQIVINLAAQAGVRHSLDAPFDYVTSNLTGFLSVLEACRHHAVDHLVYASSSSVYGLNTAMPFSEHHVADHPISLYAATKRANELMAHAYGDLFAIPATGLRFFTVYGPWGRPDMALFKFAKAMLAGEPIDIYNHGKMQRDFTFVDDIVEGIVRVADVVPKPDPDWNGDAPDPATSGRAPHRVFNIGNSRPVELMDYIEALEAALGTTAKKNFLPMQPGDVAATYADTSDLAAATGFAPRTPVTEGVAAFVAWYRDYYNV
ncbi:NAD-dependent epimerase [Rhodobium gokarnense]|uniref:UDP-glucuronate 4-epimerase n=1 Tax=Rhodobium gokarnense TaxID=364296 RepID=A0ABT3HFS3_9HYPH|nr:NAD-dependent epimerase [Rhodobium gokarnense]MCW2309248.1 UDP-glucuronate 4-epimerase [Rhodobium gokarnense]